MLTYTAAYVWHDGEDKADQCVTAEVLDFPGAVSFGDDLNAARRAIADALVDLAESLLLDGKLLPLPNPECAGAPEYQLTEPIYLLLNASTRLKIVAQDPAA